MSGHHAPPAATSSWSRPAGWALSLACVAILIASATSKLATQLLPASDAVSRFGYPDGTLGPIALVEIACALLYVMPRTSVLGAILLTGYLGGAIATHVRIEDAAFLFPFVLGIVAWLGLYLRDPRLRAVVRPPAFIRV